MGQIDKKIEKFEKRVNTTKNHIKNKKEISDEEKELLYMSLDTLCEFISAYKKEK